LAKLRPWQNQLWNYDTFLNKGFCFRA
jgi:hypothetical protein